ncbi:unnamed protein product [Paramecium octaurelia]|uniref:GB1/RHD3-type G domain-containing protein n=1 Tax=Paramecium octaurelia TaxID=43137 RepID=A0A8S1T0M1_PAROT|nr:unnamed protein product [Paramecium octaurelia]
MQQSPRAIQLIAIEPQTKKLVLCQEAVQIIKSFNDKCKNFAVIVVVGKYRTGKSYLINQLLLQQSRGFEVGSTINACTKGLWMWSELIYFESNKSKEPIPAILIDTEGIGSVEEDMNHDVKVFLLAMLMSSYFIYNSVGTIDDMALQNLGLIVNLTKMLQKADQNTQKDLFETFPSFLWILRDFTLRLQDEYGNKILPKDYLEAALKPLKGISETIENKNKIRRHISQFFAERDCITLVRPTEDEKALQELSSVKFEELRVEFQEQVLALRKKLSFKVQFKQYKGKAITPFTFIEMSKYFVDAINEGSLPEIATQWQMIQEQEFEYHINTQIEYYKQAIEEFFQDQDLGDLVELNQILLKKIKNYLEGNSEKEIFIKRWKSVKKDLERLFNDSQRRYQDIQLIQLETIKNNFIDEIHHYDKEDFWGIVDIANNAVSEYLSKNININELQNYITQIWESTVQRIQHEFHIIKNLSNLHIQIQSKQELEIRRLQTELQSYQEFQLEDNRQKDKLIEKLKSENEQMKKRNSVSETLISDLKLQIEQLQQDHNQQLKSIDNQNKQELNKLRSIISKFEQRVIDSNVNIDKFSNLYQQQEKEHLQELNEFKIEILKLNSQISDYQIQIKENRGEIEGDKKSENYYSARKQQKHNTNDCAFINNMQKQSENTLQEWKYQKEYIRKQLQEAYYKIQEEKKQNDALINSLKQY